jgi:ATP-binding cassette subfamily B protein
MIEACKSAQIWAMISALPNGLETMVGERGHRLSGGEKQRLAIARMMLKAPSIVILDEATAHLDSENEELVQAALKVALQGRTSIVIAHRLSTIMNADQILVMENGVIAERGRHTELMSATGLYSELFSRQDLTTN